VADSDVRKGDGTSGGGGVADPVRVGVEGAGEGAGGPVTRNKA